MRTKNQTQIQLARTRHEKAIRKSGRRMEEAANTTTELANNCYAVLDLCVHVHDVYKCKHSHADVYANAYPRTPNPTQTHKHTHTHTHTHTRTHAHTHAHFQPRTKTQTRAQIQTHTSSTPPALSRPERSNRPAFFRKIHLFAHDNAQSSNPSRAACILFDAARS